jgi:aryl-alcohol dehydrogenase-like predicted oxidoreductase
MDAADWRRGNQDFQAPQLQRNLALRNSLRPMAERYGCCVGAVAVAWALAWPGVTGAIVGARSPEQVDGWIDAAELQLSEGDLREIASAISQTAAGSGPVYPVPSTVT